MFRFKGTITRPNIKYSPGTFKECANSMGSILFADRIDITVHINCLPMYLKYVYVVNSYQCVIVQMPEVLHYIYIYIYIYM